MILKPFGTHLSKKATAAFGIASSQVISYSHIQRAALTSALPSSAAKGIIACSG